MKPVALFLAAASLFWAAQTIRAFGLFDTPAVVQTAITGQIGDGKLGDIVQTNEDGETTFDVSFTAKAGDEHGFTVADDGTILSVEVKLTDLPSAAQKTIQTLLADWKLDDLNKNLTDTEVSYEADVSKDGHGKYFTVGEDGVLQDMEVTLAETPAAVQATITGQLADGTLQSIDENFDSDGNSFDVVVLTKAGGRKTFSVGLDGTLLSMGVSLEQVPPPVRRTIHEKIGAGKILEIDKSLVEKVDNVLPYEVQGRKSGLPFNFNVGPRGRFLGMEE